MRTIWKFPLRVDAYQEIGMPRDSQILSVQCQGEQLCIWALVNPQNSLVPTSIRIIGTGHPVESEQTLSYIGTAQMYGGGLVWHVFKVNQ